MKGLQCRHNLKREFREIVRCICRHPEICKLIDIELKHVMETMLSLIIIINLFSFCTDLDEVSEKQFKRMCSSNYSISIPL